MELEGNKISSNQGITIFFVLIVCPMLTLIPKTVFRVSELAWVTPIISYILMFGLVFLINRIKKHNIDKTFFEILYKYFGRKLGKVIIFLNIITTFFMVCCYIRSVGEKISATCYNEVDYKVFVFILLIMISIVVSKGIKVIARMSEIILPIIVLSVIFIIVFTIFNIEIEYLIPIKKNNFQNIIRSSIETFGIWLLITNLIFVEPRLFYKKLKRQWLLKKIGVMSLLYISVIITVIGNLGCFFAGELYYPFFTLAKKISISGMFEKVQILVIFIWTASDFVFILFFTYTTLYFIKEFLELKNMYVIKNILLVLIFIVSSIVGTTKFQVDIIIVKSINIQGVIMLFTIIGLNFSIKKIRKKNKEY